MKFFLKEGKSYVYETQRISCLFTYCFTLLNADIFIKNDTYIYMIPPSRDVLDHSLFDVQISRNKIRKHIHIII